MSIHQSTNISAVPHKLKSTKRLTDEQLEFIGETTTHCVVVAIPGSGKSTAIAAKTQRLVSMNESVICVTFTNEAANDLRQKALYGLDPVKQRLCRIGTFHGLLKQELEARSDSPLAGLKILNDADAEIQRKLALQAFDVEVSDETLKWFETAYSKVTDRFGLDAALGLGVRDPKRSKAIAEAQKRQKVLAYYEKHLRDHLGYDMSRILLTALEFMVKGQRLLVAQHVMVDEFQDVDEVQLHLVLRLAQWSRIDVVGDDDQSIYGFRSGLGYLAFQQFKSELAPTTLAFTLNYRCRAEILEWARIVIEQNNLRIYKPLKPDRGPGGRLRLVTFESEAQEHAVVCEWIVQALEGGAKTVAVAAATKKALIDIQTALTDRVEFRRAGVKSFWERPAASVAVSLLRAIDKSQDHAIGLENALHLYGVDGSQVKLINDLSSGKGLYQGFLPARKHEAITDNTRQAMVWLEELLISVSYTRTTRSESEVDETIQVTLDALLEAVATNPTLQDWKRELMSAHLETARDVLQKLHGSLRARLNVVSRQLENAREAPVTLLTLHGSKGLQFDAVFIINASERQLPSDPSGPAETEEKRRLLYVGMTRARDHLTITCSRRGFSSGRKPNYMTSLLSVFGSPWEERGEDHLWMLRR
jgi:superfamily I DNA/RNA helicase